jgi:anti-sigma factor RsiW
LCKNYTHIFTSEAIVKTCEEYQELVSAYVDGEILDDETAELFFHLGACPECRQFLSSVLRLQSFMQVTDVPDNRHAAMKQEIDAPDSRLVAMKQPPMWKRKLAVSYPVAAAVVALMLLSGGLYATKQTQPPAVIHQTQTEYVYLAPMDLVNVIASPLPPKKTN